MAKEFIHGRMEENMKGNISKIERMVLVLILGLMEKNMKDVGKMVNNMAKESTFFQKVLLEKEFGKMEKKLKI